MYIYVYIHIYIYTQTCVYIYTYIYIYIYLWLKAFRLEPARPSLAARSHMPYHRLEPAPAPLLAGQTLWLELVGVRSVAGRLLLFLKLTSAQGVETFYVASVDVADRWFPD